MRTALVVMFAAVVVFGAVSPANGRIGRDGEGLANLNMVSYSLTINLYDEHHKLIMPVDGSYQLKVRQGVGVVIVEFDGRQRKQIRPRRQDLRFSSGQWMTVKGPAALVLVPMATGNFNLTVVSAKTGISATIRINVTDPQRAP